MSFVVLKGCDRPAPLCELLLPLGRFMWIWRVCRQCLREVECSVGLRRRPLEAAFAPSECPLTTAHASRFTVV